MLLGLCPRSPSMEKQLRALLICHSWIRGRVCVIISHEIEIREGKRKESKRKKGSPEMYFHFRLRKFSINRVQAVPGLAFSF